MHDVKGKNVSVLLNMLNLSFIEDSFKKTLRKKKIIVLEVGIIQCDKSVILWNKWTSDK